MTSPIAAKKMPLRALVICCDSPLAVTKRKPAATMTITAIIPVKKRRRLITFLMVAPTPLPPASWQLSSAQIPLEPKHARILVPFAPDTVTVSHRFVRHVPPALVQLSSWVTQVPFFHKPLALSQFSCGEAATAGEVGAAISAMIGRATNNKNFFNTAPTPGPAQN